MKGKIVDFFTGKVMDKVQQDTSNNDKLAMDGVYVGNIHKSKAKYIRTQTEILRAKEEQINKMVEVWEKEMMDYMYNIDEVLHVLNVDGFDPRTHDMSVSEDGHVWIVPVVKGDKK